MKVYHISGEIDGCEGVETDREADAEGYRWVDLFIDCTDDNEAHDIANSLGITVHCINEGTIEQAAHEGDF